MLIFLPPTCQERLMSTIIRPSRQQREAGFFWGLNDMRNLMSGLILSLVAVLVFSDTALAQEETDLSPGPGWLPAVRRHSLEAQRQDRIKYKIDERKHDPRDLNGMWGKRTGDQEPRDGL